MSDKVFCPSPWNGLYVHLNKSLPCPFNKGNNDYSPLKYYHSSFLKELKNHFFDGTFHQSCNVCESRELDGLKSGRQEFLKYCNEGDFDSNDSSKLKRLEVRFSNLCNFKCRMCESYSSSEFAREIGFKFKNVSGFVVDVPKRYIDELKLMLGDLEYLTLTGGEPFLIKQYYDFIDYIVSKGYAKNITITIYTNGSVMNDLMIERLKHFKTVNLNISLDGIELVAEYISSGTKWKTVKNNIDKFIKMPFNVSIHTVLQPYTLFDMFRFSEYLVDLYKNNDKLIFKCYTLINPKALNINNIGIEHRRIAISEIEKSLEIIKYENFKNLYDELRKIVIILKENNPNDVNSFVEFTKRFDDMRNEKFENVFGFSL